MDAGCGRGLFECRGGKTAAATFFAPWVYEFTGGFMSNSMSEIEIAQVLKYLEYTEVLNRKYCLVGNLADYNIAKIIKSSNASRYFQPGRKRIKARIRKRLGKWYNCQGLMITLTFDPKIITREDAWRTVGRRVTLFMEAVNQRRKRKSFTKAKYIMVLEEQKGTGYPHVHLVFPKLKYLCDVTKMKEYWNQAPNSVDCSYLDNFSPVGYMCKYITKMEGWTDCAMAHIWTNKTRLYRMSQDYSMPDYGERKVPEWQFRSTMTEAKAVALIINSYFDELTVPPDIMPLVLAELS